MLAKHYKLSQEALAVEAHLFTEKRNRSRSCLDDRLMLSGVLWALLRHFLAKYA
jgi:hypothetical protein